MITAFHRPPADIALDCRPDAGEPAHLTRADAQGAPAQSSN
jgi:hypothetical protein